MAETSVFGAGNVGLELVLGTASGPRSVERAGSRMKSRRRLLRAGATLLAFGLAGCSGYHPLPLPQGPNLVRELAQLDLVVPPVEGKPSVKIDPTRPITPDEVGLLAILNDPELVGSRLDIDLAQADLDAASTLPNPSVSLAYQFLLGGPGVADAFTAAISQDIRSIITYHSHVEAATARYHQVSANLLWEEWQAAQSARLLAVEIYGGEKEIQLRERAVGTLADEIKHIRAAVDAGNLDITVAGPLFAAEAGAQRDLGTAKLTQLKNWQELNGLLGLQPSARFAIAVPEPVKLPPDLEPLIVSLPNRRPDLIALRLGYDAADSDVRAEILGQFPTFSLGGSYGSDTSKVRSAGPQATFDLPIFDRNQASVKTAQVTRAQLRAEYQSRLDDADGTARSLIVQNREIAAYLDRARSAAASASQQSDAAQKAYARNDFSQRDLADFQATALERELDLLDYEQKLVEGSLALSIELGLGLPPVTLAPQSSDQVKRP